MKVVLEQSRAFPFRYYFCLHNERQKEVTIMIILLILYMISSFIVSIFAMYCYNVRDVNAIYATIIFSVFWPVIIPVLATIGIFTKRGRKSLNKLCNKMFN